MQWITTRLPRMDRLSPIDARAEPAGLFCIPIPTHLACRIRVLLRLIWIDHALLLPPIGNSIHSLSKKKHKIVV